jgi:xanthine dehydrogenase/oxidase
LFAESVVTSHGQLIGIIIAESQMIAQRAAKLVKVEYEELPHILTIEDAIRAQSFLGLPRRLLKGNPAEALAASKFVLHGTVRMGGQEHFYLETNASIAIPREGNEMEIIASTQNPTETQHLVARVLNYPSHRVYCKTRRIGGGFGGKESRSAFLSAAVAVAANKLKCPVRCMLDRDEDIVCTGQRHPFMGQYTVGFEENGEINALELKARKPDADLLQRGILGRSVGVRNGQGNNSL